MKRALLIGVVLLALVAAAPTAAQMPFVGYDGSKPFRCKLQRVGRGVDFPDPKADPFCVAYDKTDQNLSRLGLVDFLANEPARVAAAGDVCFYYQRDHWRGSIDQANEQSETYHWDGGYFFDKARGVFGAHARNFTINNVSGDPRGLPGFPEQWRPYFGWGRGGVQTIQGIPVDPACVKEAERKDPYRRGAETGAANGEPLLQLGFLGRLLP